MAKLSGALIVLEFEEIKKREWQDATTKTMKSRQTIVGLMENGDRTVDRVEINLPRDSTWQPPSDLVPGQHYVFPVLPIVGWKDHELSYTIRTDLPPLPAPEVNIN